MLTQQYLRSVLDYDRETGIFRWKIQKGQRGSVGSIAGTDHEGYVRILIDRKKYLAHRLAWLYVYGLFPNRLIDHKNCIKSDNKLSNLREANDSENQCNTTLRKSNTTGFKNIIKYGNYWVCQINKNKMIYKKYFVDINEAIIWRDGIKASRHKEFGRNL